MPLLCKAKDDILVHSYKGLGANHASSCAFSRVVLLLPHLPRASLFAENRHPVSTWWSHPHYEKRFLPLSPRRVPVDPPKAGRRQAPAVLSLGRTVTGPGTEATADAPSRKEDPYGAGMLQWGQEEPGREGRVGAAARAVPALPGHLPEGGGGSAVQSPAPGASSLRGRGACGSRRWRRGAADPSRGSPHGAEPRPGAGGGCCPSSPSSSPPAAR